MKKNIMIFILGLYLALLFAGTPKWITDLESAFPDKSFIRAVGEGRSEASAKKAALAELSSYFGQTIKSENQAVQISRQSDASYEEKLDLRCDLNSYSEVDLLCVHYTTAWYNKRTDSFYVCAYLDRAEFWDILKQKIESLASKLEALYKSAKLEKDLFKKSMILEEARSVYEECKLLFAKALAVYPSKFGQYEKILECFLEKLQELADLKRKVVVSVLVNGDKDGQIRAKLCELLRKYGITVCGEDKASAANSNYTLSAQVLWNDKKHNTVYSSTPQIDFTIKGSGNTGTVYSYSGSCEKVATYNVQTTEQMAISRLEELLDQLQLWR